MNQLANIFCIVSLAMVAFQILQYLRIKILCKKYEAALPSGTVGLDPRKDAMLFGLPHWTRLELFDMWQRKYLKISSGSFKKRNKPERELEPLQQKIMSAIEEESQGKRCGTLIKEMEDEASVKSAFEESQKKYIDLHLLYPEECGYSSLLIMVGKTCLYLGVCIMAAILLMEVSTSVTIGIWICPVLPWLMAKVAEKTLSPLSSRGQHSVDLMREKWAGQKMKRADDEAGNERNVAILGALGMVALEGTQFQSFLGTLPSAVSSSSAGISSGGCSSASCSSCGGGGGDGGGGGGGCGGGCGGCGGG